MSGILADAPEHDRPKVARPAVGTRFRCHPYPEIAEVTEHTARGFKYCGAHKISLVNLGMYGTGEGEMFTDIPEWPYMIEGGTIEFLP